mmetsp:Transcript_20092/g.51129  ORF Transcript_20092/g.51129 Transcript_20092/m.51129 type:complete len:385 (+) Transcript_20092:75-1229(+)
MSRAIVDQLADKLQQLPPAERRAALQQVEELLHDSALHQPSGRRQGTAMATFFTLFLVVVLATQTTVRTVGGADRNAQLAVPEHGPVGILPVGVNTACQYPLGSHEQPVPTAVGEGRVAKTPLSQVQLMDIRRAHSEVLPMQQYAGAWHRRQRSEYPSHGAFDHPRDALKEARSGEWNASDFPLLLCVGQGKTATKSLNKAFVMLGLQTAHFYGAGVYGLLYDNAAEAKHHSFMFNVNEAKHVDAVLDTPVVDFYQELLLSYPKAKVILTIREPKSWLRSQQKFYGNFARSCRNWLAPWRRGSNLVYGTECPSKEQAIKRYVQHNRNVYDSVPPDRLLVMDIPGGDGWEKLCSFLGMVAPQCPPTDISQCRKAGVDNCEFPSRH